MNHMSITINHGIASTNQINKRYRTSWYRTLTEASWKKKTLFPSRFEDHIILQIQLPCKDTSLQHHTFDIHFTFPKNLQLLQFGLGRFEILIIFQLLNAARLLSPLATIVNLKIHVLYTAHKNTPTSKLGRSIQGATYYQLLGFPLRHICQVISTCKLSTCYSGVV